MENLDETLQANKKKVLVVEDNNSLREIIVRRLISSGYSVIAVSTGKDAIKQLQANPDAVLLLDMFLPDMTGRDVLNHLKKLSIEVPFVVMTGKGNENLAVEMMKLGAADYLIKDTKYYEVLPRVMEKVFENALFEKKLKKAEESLKTSEANLNSIFKAMQDLVLVVDSNGNFVETSFLPLEAKVEKPTYFQGNSLFEVFSEDLANKYLEAVKNTLSAKSAKHLDYEIVKGNDTAYYSASIFPFTENTVLWIAQDITKRRMAEKSLAEKEERFRSIFESASIGMYRTLPDGEVLMANPALINLLGRDSLEEFLSLDLSNAIYEDPNKRDEFLDAIRTKGEIKGFESALIKKDGTKVFVRENVKAIYSEDGKMKYFEGTVEDITEQIVAKKALWESEEVFSKLLQTIPDLIIKTDLEGNITFANDAKLLTDLGLKNESIIGKNIISFISEKDKQFAINNLKLMFEGLVGIVNEYQIVIGDNIRIDCEINGNLIADENNQPASMVFVIRDISERKQVQEEYRILFENAGTYILVAEENNTISLCNESLAKSIGYSTEEVNGKMKWTEFVYEDDLSEMQRQHKLRRAQPELAKSNYEFRFKTRTGEIRNAILNATMIPETKKSIIAITDITERKQAEEMYRALFENTGTSMVVLEEDTTISLTNETYTKVTGYTSEETDGKMKWTDIVFKEDIETMLEQHKLRRHNPEMAKASYEFRVKTKFGEIKDALLSITMIPGTKKSIASLIDITERKQAEERYKVLFNNTGTNTIIVEEDGTISLSNDTFLENSGYSREEIDGKMKWIELVCEEYISEMIAQHQLRRTHPEKSKSVYEFKLKTKSGEIKNGILNVKIIPGTKRSITSIIDITEVRQAEQKLREQETKVRLLTHHAYDAIVMMNSYGETTFWNPSAEKLFGYKKEEVLGKRTHSIITPERYRQDFLNALLNFKETGEGKIVGKTTEMEAVKKDGSEISIGLSLSAFKVNGEWNAVAIMRDITERKKYEKEVKALNESLEIKVKERTAELKDALKRIEESNIELKELNESIALDARKLYLLNEKLAASENELKIANQTKDKFFSIISHDLRNPIGSQRNLLELLSQHFEGMPGEEVLKLINMLYESSNHTVDLLENLLQWSRVQSNRIEFAPTNNTFYYAVERCISLVSPAAKDKNISLKNLVSKSVIAYYDNFFVETTLRNLLTNAIKFTHNGGEVEVGAKEITISSFNQESNFIEVYVKDSGLGMSKEFLEKLFRIDENVTMLGTAKEKGTGLGLILCKEFVEKQGGRIWVESEEGVGSTFYFTIPAAD